MPLRVLAGGLGIFLFAYVLHRAGPANLLQSMSSLGRGVGLVIAWGAVGHIAKTWAWRLILLDDKRQVSFARVLGLRLACEAAGQLGGLGQLAGGGLRVSMLGPTIPLT